MRLKYRCKGCRRAAYSVLCHRCRQADRRQREVLALVRFRMLGGAQCHAEYATLRRLNDLRQRYLRGLPLFPEPRKDRA